MAMTIDDELELRQCRAAKQRLIDLLDLNEEPRWKWLILEVETLQRENAEFERMLHDSRSLYRKLIDYFKRKK